ncbi:hypothetical protein F4808DRAFT_433186 [Astrocystis sublimbata]|nr:hypothetical protein F4808DRAFT_433186 [Astrocystis sublimbata]
MSRQKEWYFQLPGGFAQQPHNSSLLACPAATWTDQRCISPTGTGIYSVIRNFSLLFSTVLSCNLSLHSQSTYNGLILYLVRWCDNSLTAPLFANHRDPSSLSHSLALLDNAYLTHHAARTNRYPDDPLRCPRTSSEGLIGTFLHVGKVLTYLSASRP